MVYNFAQLRAGLEEHHFLGGDAGVATPGLQIEGSLDRSKRGHLLPLPAH